jgi:microcystin-dependent protein
MSVFKITDIRHPASSDSNIVLFGNGTVSVPSLLLDEHALGDLGDVNTAGAQNEDVLTFDTTTSKWVSAPLPAPIPGVPTGAISLFGGASAPSGWLNCDGAAVSRATYAGLFSVIGTAYGSGNGSTTFNLPDFRLRFPRGSGSGSAIGASTNNNTHAHTVNVADGNHAHTHTVASSVSSSVSGNFSGTSSNEPNHTHATNTNATGAATTNNTGNHSHSVSVPGGGSATTGSVGNTFGHRVVVAPGNNSIVTGINHTHNVPNHTHNVSQVNTGEHTHNTNNHNHTINEGGGGSHSHTVSGNISGNFSTNFNTTSGAASSATHSHTASSGDEAHLPAYVTVGYIIKT